VRAFGAAPDGSDLIAKLVGELNQEAPQTPDALHRNKVSGHRTAVPKRVEGRNSGAEQWCCFNVT